MARWTTLGGYPVKQYNSPNRGGAMDDHRGVVCHIAEGTYLGTISWQMNPDQRYASGGTVTTCSTWVVGKQRGEIAQMVDTDEIAWCQRGGSRTWLSIEFAGYNTGALTAWQIEAAALILAKVHEHYGVPLQVAPDPSVHGLGHHSMDREWLGEEWGHDDCPGSQIVAQKPQIVAAAIQLTNGDDDMAQLYIVKGTLPVYLYDGYGRRHVPDPAALKRVQLATGLGAPVVLASQADLDLIAPLPPVPADVDEVALAAALEPLLPDGVDLAAVAAVMRAELDKTRLSAG